MLLHEQLVPYVRAAAAHGGAAPALPIIRPLCLTDPADPRGWSIDRRLRLRTGAVGRARCSTRGRASARSPCRRGRWIETWSGREVRGGGELIVRQRRLSAIPVWVRAGSIVVTHPIEAIRRGLADHARARSAR